MKWFFAIIIGLVVTSCCIEPADLKIYTSLKPNVNKALTAQAIRLQDSVYPYIKWEHRETKAWIDSLKALNQFLNVGVVAIDNKTGQVVIHYSSKSNSSGDFVTNRGSIGDMNKTLLYALAMQKEFTPYDRYPQMKQVPDGDYDDLVPDSTIDRSFLRTFGFSFNGTPPKGLAQRYSSKQAYASLLLLMREGYIENHDNSYYLFDAQLSLLDLTKTWSAFYNKGIRNDPTVINRIVDVNNKELYRRKAHSTRILDEQTAEEMLHLLDFSAHLGRGTFIHRKFPNAPDFIGNIGGFGFRNNSGVFISITKDYTIGVKCVPAYPNIRINEPDNFVPIPFVIPFWLKSTEKLKIDKPHKNGIPMPLYRYVTVLEDEIPEIEI
ncbi:MAG: hypothetical protein HYZ43_02000 [Flavobacteriia bacterium]|nr:hypothetical protein [Flavobacteriia bacterium]